MNPLRKLKIKTLKAACSSNRLDWHKHTRLLGIDPLTVLSVLGFSTTPGIMLYHSGTSLAKANSVTVIWGDLLCPEAVNQFSRSIASRWHLAHLNYHGFKFFRAAEIHSLSSWDNTVCPTLLVCSNHHLSCWVLSLHFCRFAQYAIISTACLCESNLTLPFSTRQAESTHLLFVLLCHISCSNISTKNCNSPLIRTFVFRQRNIWPVSMSWWITH